MSEFSSEPAQTYQFNILASVLGRFAVPDLDSATRLQATDMLERVVEEGERGRAPVPHTNSELLQEAVKFDDKLIGMLEQGPASERLPAALRRVTQAQVQRHATVCQEMHDKQASFTQLVEVDTIARAYGLPDLWQDPQAVISDEFQRWGSFVTHPPVPADLQRRVSLPETNQLMRLMWEHVITAPRFPEVRSYLTDKVDGYHVFWAPLAETLDYATPSNYDRATQLSFDLPHNATHLAHLDEMNRDQGVFRYDDSMAQRAYFEALTVFSEWTAIEQAKANQDFITELHTILQPSALSPQELAEWVVQDRGYEFKLRTARYAADVLMMQGFTFEDTTHEIAARLSIPLTDAEKETKKYLPWTGLGAIYTFGYRKLLALGTTSVHEAMVDADHHDQAVTSWHQKLAAQ